MCLGVVVTQGSVLDRERELAVWHRDGLYWMYATVVTVRVPGIGGCVEYKEVTRPPSARVNVIPHEKTITGSFGEFSRGLVEVWIEARPKMRAPQGTARPRKDSPNRTS